MRNSNSKSKRTACKALVTTSLALLSTYASVSALEFRDAAIEPAVAITRPAWGPPRDSRTVPEAAVPAFDCDIRAYVRAPDLFSGQRAYGEARLVANGTSCNELVSWDVVLRMRERSVVRLPDPTIKLPPRPVYNRTLEREYHANRSESYDSGWNNIISHGNGAFRAMDRELSPYDKAMEEYNDFMANKSIWKVHSAERQIFETSAGLAQAGSSKDTIPLKAVKKFGIAVPECRYPPTSYGEYSYEHGRTEAVVAESQLDYFFRIGLRNSSSIEVPAGTTVFGNADLPVRSTQDQAISQSSSTEFLTTPVLLRRTTDHGWDVDSQDFRDEILRERYESSSPQYELLVTAPPSMIQGQNYTIKAKIKSLNATSPLLPTGVSVNAYTFPTYPWAALSAFSPEQGKRLLTQGVERGHLESYRSVRQRRARKVKHQDFEEYPEDGHVIDAIWMRGRRPPRSATKLDANEGDAFEQTFDVAVNVPEDLLPSHETTFVNFTSYLSFELWARGPVNEDIAPNDLDDESLWQGHPVRHTHEHTRFSGKLEIRIKPVPAEDKLAKDVPYYDSDACMAPELLDHPASHDEAIKLQPVSTELREESALDRLLTHKYIVPDCHSRGEHSCGGRYEMVGNVWAMKVYRESMTRPVNNRPKLVLQTV